MKNYFAVDFDNSTHFFETENEARKFAADALEEAQDISGDTGWPDGTTDICYGKLIGVVVETKRVDRPDTLDENREDAEGNYWASDDWSHMLWHELQEVKP
jgi:hypothetical protein